MSVKELFSKVKILNGGTTPVGFYCDFLFEENFSSDHLDAIDARMRSLVERQLEIKFLEMIRSNAKTYLEHLKEDPSKIKNSSEIVQLIQINNYTNVVDGPLLANTRELKFFKLFDFERIDGKIRIFGVLLGSQDEVKQYLKDKKNSDKDHISLGEELSLFYLEGNNPPLFTDRGLSLYQIIVDFLVGQMKNDNFLFVKQANEESSLKILINKDERFKEIPLKIAFLKEKSNPLNDLFKGLYRAEKGEYIEQIVLCSKELLLKEVIYSLKFFVKILKILGLNSYSVSFGKKEESKKRSLEEEIIEEALKECRIEYENNGSSLGFFVRDRNLWPHEIFTLSITPFNSIEKKGLFLVKRSTGPVNNIMGLFLEMTEGNLPFCFLPEQVRLIPISDESLEYVYEIKKNASVRSFIDNGSRNLKAKVYSAIKAKIPFIVVIGERERESQTVSFREFWEEEMHHTTMDAFLERLQNKQKKESAGSIA